MSTDIRLRFAPSPTGPLHIGGVRTALYNYFFAKKNKGKFILRIEDTDQSRTVNKAEEYIIETFKWLRICPDEGFGFGDGKYGPYKQSLRKDIYKQYVEQLIDKGYAYYGFDSVEDLENMRNKNKSSNLASYNYVTRMSMKNSLTMSKEEVAHKLAQNIPFVIRLKVPIKEEINCSDLVRGNIKVHSSSIDDKVLIKADGMPTYHLANVVDDYLMKISHVIRGEEWLPSLPVHILLYRYLGFEARMPEFAHLPLLLKPDGNGKLSKRDGDQLGFPVFPLNWENPKTNEIYRGYRESGYLTEAVINMLSLLGWNPGENQELMSKETIIDLFDIDRIAKSGAKFNPQKAKWFNQQYLRLKKSEEILNIIEEKNILIKHHKNYSKKYITDVIELFKEKLFFIDDFVEVTSYMFERPSHFDEKFMKKKINTLTRDFTLALIDRLKKEDCQSAEMLEEKFNEIAISFNEKPTHFMPSVRFMITGQKGGPPLFEMMMLLTIPEVRQRLATFINDVYK